MIEYAKFHGLIPAQTWEMFYISLTSTFIAQSQLFRWTFILSRPASCLTGHRILFFVGSAINGSGIFYSVKQVLAGFKGNSLRFLGLDFFASFRVACFSGFHQLYRKATEAAAPATSADPSPPR